MTKSEFLRGLRGALSGAPDSLILENINYYSDYIDGEIRKGRSEEEVMEELGEPQWIAKSILDASEGNTWTGSSYGTGATAYEYDTDGEPTYDSGYEDEASHRSFHTIDFSKWYVKALMISIPLLIIFIILSVMGLAFRIMISLLTSPVFWCILLVLALLGWFTKRR